MKRTWFTLCIALAMVSGAMPRLLAAQDPGSSCPLTDEPFCDYGPEPRFANAPGDALESPQKPVVLGPVGAPDSHGHFWDGYADYLLGLYPYDYYDDTAELSWSSSPKGSAPVADGSHELDEQHSPLYGIEGEVNPLAAGEYSPLYGLEEANAWAEARRAHDDHVPGATPHGPALSAQKTQAAVSPEQRAQHDDVAMGDGVECRESHAAQPSGEVFEYEYSYDNYEYWYGDDNNSPPVLSADSESAYDEHFYQRYEAAVRPQYSNAAETAAEPRLPPLEEMPAENEAASNAAEFTYDGYESVGGDDGYGEAYPSYGDEAYGYEESYQAYPESYEDLDYEPYGYEYDYGSDDEFSGSDQWGSGVDDLYAYESDVNGQPLADEADEADVQEADVQEADVQEADVQEADVQEADVQEADVQEAPDSVSNPTDSWGEGDFYSSQLPQDYESQWDGTAHPAPQPIDDYWSQYEEAWFEHNDRDYESDYEPSNDFAEPTPEPATESTNDYWEEFSNYVEPRGAMEHGQYWYGEEEDWQAWEEEGSGPQFVPAHSPIPESYWPEEYQPYDVATNEGTESTPSVMPRAARMAITPIWWATQLVREQWIARAQQVVGQLRQRAESAEQWMRMAATLAPYEERAEDGWDCDRAWNAAERHEEIVR